MSESKSASKEPSVSQKSPPESESLPKRGSFISKQDEADIIENIQIWLGLAGKAWKKEDTNETDLKKKIIHAIVLADQLNCSLCLGELEIKPTSFSLYSRHGNKSLTPSILYLNKESLTLKQIIHEFLHHYDCTINDPNEEGIKSSEEEIRDETRRILLLAEAETL